MNKRLLLSLLLVAAACHSSDKSPPIHITAKSATKVASATEQEVCSNLATQFCKQQLICYEGSPSEAACVKNYRLQHCLSDLNCKPGQTFDVTKAQACHDRLTAVTDLSSCPADQPVECDAACMPAVVPKPAGTKPIAQRETDAAAIEGGWTDHQAGGLGVNINFENDGTFSWVSSDTLQAFGDEYKGCFVSYVHTGVYEFDDTTKRLKLYADAANFTVNGCEKLDLNESVATAWPNDELDSWSTSHSGTVDLIDEEVLLHSPSGDDWFFRP